MPEVPVPPAEARLRALLSELAGAPAPGGPALSRSVVRTVRWQRPVRRTAVTLASAADALAVGAAAALRTHRRT
jgi:hypothetical protein